MKPEAVLTLSVADRTLTTIAIHITMKFKIRIGKTKVSAAREPKSGIEVDLILYQLIK
jgi:hypothetical protein